jgi:transposase
MSRKKRFIEKLTAAQNRSLERGYRTGKSHFYRRKCHCILLSNKGKTVQELANLYGVKTRTVYSWFDLWESEGIKGLALKPGRGRKPKLNVSDEIQVKTVKVLIENEPKNLNRVVGQIKSQLDIDLSKKTLKRFLKNLNTNGSDFVNG